MYVRIAGRRESARMALDALAVEIGDVRKDEGEDDDGAFGARSARSIMKFPAARFAGLRGRCKKSEISYGCSETRLVEREAIP